MFNWIQIRTIGRPFKMSAVGVLFVEILHNSGGMGSGISIVILEDEPLINRD